MKGAGKFINIQLNAQFDRLANYLTFLFFKDAFQDEKKKVHRERFFFRNIKLSWIATKIEKEIANMKKENKIKRGKGKERKRMQEETLKYFILRRTRSSGKISANKGANTVLLCVTKGHDTRIGFIAGIYT